MRKFTAVVLVGLSCVSVSVTAKEAAHWEYAGEQGPSHWAELDPAYLMCSQGKNQSPINLTGFTKADLAPIRFDYRAAVTEVINNGHTIQDNFPQGSSITVDGKVFELKQFHFHSPSENQINGKTYPMEVHLVHADRDGNLAVVAILLESGADNPHLAKVWKNIPKQSGEKRALSETIDATKLLPAEWTYYKFSGSLTTPPCTEGVRWRVMKHAVSLSPQAIKTFEQVMHHNTNRPVQPVYARPVLE